MPYITPAEESRRNSRLANDIDNLRSRYLEESTIMDSSNNPMDFSVIFPAFEVYSFEKNRFYLMSNCAPIQFIKRWENRPDYVSYDTFGTVIYWPIILFVNGVDSIEDFKGFDKIMIPSPQAAKALSGDRLSKNAIEKVIDEPVPDQGQAFKYKAFLFDDYVASRREAEELLNPETSTVTYAYINQEKTEVFTFTQDMIWYKTITLNDEPMSITTISAYMEGYQMPLRYGIDYMMTSSKNLTWSADYNELLSKSLLNSLSDKLGKTLTVKYITLVYTTVTG